MQGAEDRRLRRMNYTPQGGEIEGNAADDILMVDQGSHSEVSRSLPEHLNTITRRRSSIRFFPVAKALICSDTLFSKLFILPALVRLVHIY